QRNSKDFKAIQTKSFFTKPYASRAPTPTTQPKHPHHRSRSDERPNPHASSRQRQNRLAPERPPRRHQPHARRRRHLQGGPGRDGKARRVPQPREYLQLV